MIEQLIRVFKHRDYYIQMEKSATRCSLVIRFECTLACKRACVRTNLCDTSMMLHH